MAKLLDTNLWIDLTRRRSPRALKAFIRPFVDDPQACLCEPIVFELLRSATGTEARQLTEHFETMPVLASPHDLWSSAAKLGRQCHAVGFTAGSIDLLIATIAIHHGAELITFDGAFAKLAGACELRVRVLKR